MKLRTLSLPLILLGTLFCLTSLFFIWERTTPTRIAFANYHDLIPYQLTDGIPQPAEILMPAIQVDLPVFPATIKNGTWDLTTKGVSYLVSSPVPGEKGNSILYGHNWRILLGNLVNTRPGDLITVRYDDNSMKVFEVTKTQEVSPTDIAVLKQTTDTRMTIYTCSGFLDSKRFVVTATLKKVISAPETTSPSAAKV